MKYVHSIPANSLLQSSRRRERLRRFSRIRRDALDRLESRLMLSCNAYFEDGETAPLVTLAAGNEIPLMARMSAETLHASSGPMHPTEGRGETEQLVWLSLSGASNLQYRGPVVVDGISISAFLAPDPLAGQESDIVTSLLDSLEACFPGSDVTFTLDRPAAIEHSTVYIGAGSWLFDDWGQFEGLAEQVDVGNVDRSDNAFVFTDAIGASGLSARDYGRRLAEVVAHEVGHLLGTGHDNGGAGVGNPLANVAFDPKVHVEIGKDVLADVTADDKVTIDGRDYAVHPLLVTALKDYPQFFNAGAVGPDGFPDVLMGQFAVHPISHGTWLTRVLDMAWQAQSDSSFSAAEKSQILAWTYGFLTHSAGDHFAHTLVNEFAEGVAPGFIAAATDQRDLGNMLRHFMTEAYIADALAGVDRNPDRTQLPDGDFSTNSTPGIEYDAPVRFIYESLIRPFPDDPTPIVELDWEDGTLTADASLDAFVRSAGDFVKDGFKVGHKITVAGFSDSANNGTFIVNSVSTNELGVVGALADETASGDESIVVRVPKTAVTTIGVDLTDPAHHKFTRTAGSFLDDGFVAGQRFAAYGFQNNHGDFIVANVTATTLEVVGPLVADPGAGSGDEQLVVYGQRGPAIDNLFKLRDKLLTEAVSRGTRAVAGNFGQHVADLIDLLVNQQTVPQALKDKLFHAYLYNWADEIDEGIRHWGEVGLAFTKAMFDPQSRRDLENKVGASLGEDSADPDTRRSKAEDGVGILDVFMEELDDPNGDGETDDSFINHHLLPMIGLPSELGLLRSALQSFGDVLDPILQPIEDILNPFKEALNSLQEYAKNWVKEQIKNRWGFDFEVFDYILELSAKMDLAKIDIGPLEVPVFKPGDHEKLDALLGLAGAHHEPPPAGFDNFPGVEFYPNAEGRLSDGAAFSKTDFAAYANSVTLTKMLLLTENDPLGGSPASNDQLSQLYSDVLTELNGATTTYDFDLLNLHGAHGGNVLTSTLPGVAGTAPWMDSIDADQVWRQDSYTVTNSLFRVSINNDAASPAVYQEAGLAPGHYKVYATWQANVTQDVDNLINSSHPDQKISPAEGAQYTIFDGAVALETVNKNQRGFASDLEDDGLAFALIGEYTINSGTLRVELNNLTGQAQNVIAGPVLLVNVSDDSRIRIQNDRDPETLVPVPGNGYSDNPAFWTDLVYKGGGGNNPLWESSVLRPVFRELFADWRNGALDFPTLGDAPSPDPNSASIPKTELPSHATPFGPIIPDNVVEVPIPDSLRDAMFNGLDALIDLATTIEQAPPLNIEIPVLGGSLGELINISGTIDEEARQPVSDYFEWETANDGDTPTFGELFDYLSANSAIGAGIDSFQGLLDFNLDLTKTFQIPDRLLSLGEKAAALGLELNSTVDIDAIIGFVDAVADNLPKFGFGVNLATDDSLSAADRFYLRADRALLSATVDAKNINAGARLGFLRAGIVDGEVGLDASVELTFHDPNSDGRITLAEIAATPLSTLLSFNGTGTFDAMLPIEVQTSLPGLSSGSIGSVVITATDIFDPDTFDISFNGNFDEFLQFTNIDAASIVGLLGQLTFWLDEFRKSDEFADFDFPFVGSALDSVLGFADAFRDRLLFDDADDGTDGADTLLFDLNSSLEAAGLGDLLRAEITGGNTIKLIANDASINEFTVTAAAGNALGFGTTQVSSGAPAALFESITASGPVILDGNNKPQFASDVTFHVAIDGAAPVPVTVKAAETKNNETLGNDRPRLVDATNGATFNTVDEMVLKIVDALGLASDATPLVYDDTDDTLTFTLNLAEVFGQVDLPVDFSLDNLPDFLTLETGGVVRLMADGNLNLTLGVYLGDAPASTQLTGNELLTDLNGGVRISTDLRITAPEVVRTVYGQLSGDATFNLLLGDAAAVAVTVTRAAASDNISVADLAADINASLAAQGLNTEVVAVANGLRIELQKAVTGTFTSLALTSTNTDPAVKDIGFVVSQVAALPPRSIVATGALPADGKLSTDATFQLAINGGSAVSVTVTQASTANNTTRSQLVSDVNTALAAAGFADQVVALLDGDRLRLEEVTAGLLSAMVITAAADSPAVVQLGLATSQTGTVGPQRIRTTKDLAALRGRLTGDATLNISINGAAAIPVTVLAADTSTNRYSFDVVNDLQAAIDATSLKDKVLVGFSADRLNFTATGGATAFSISASGVAVTELGLAANNVGNSVDFTIGVRDGSTHGITLDGLTTLSDVINAISSQSGGKVTAAINARGTGLTLTDNTTGSATFEVVTANNSAAAIDLGIVAVDAQEGEVPDGVIEGSDIAGLRPLDRFFLQNVSASVGVHLSTPTLQNNAVVDGDGDGLLGDDGLSGAAKVGFIGVQLQGGGTIDATLGFSLTDPDGDDTDQDGNRISLAELLGALDDLDTLIAAPSLTGGGELLLDVTVTPSLQGLSVPNAQIGVVVNSFGNPFTGQAPDIQFVYPNFAQLLDFQTPEFNLQSIIAGLQALAEFLNQFEAFDFLSEPIPLVGLSVNDLIGVADRFADAVAEAEANPAGTLQFLEERLEEAFGLPQGSPVIDLVLVKDNNGTPSDSTDDFSIVKVQLGLSADFSRTLNIDFDLADALGIPDLGLNFGGGAALAASGALDLQLDFGFNPASPTDVYVFDTTGLSGQLNLAGTSLTFRAAVGPLGVFVDGGSVDVHGTLAGNTKLFDIDLDKLSALYVNGRALLTDVIANLGDTFDPQLGGAIAVDLPVYFPTDSTLAGYLRFNAGLSYLNGDFNASAVPKAFAADGITEISVTELFAFNPLDLSLLDQLLLGVDGIDLFLEGLQDIFDGEIGGVSLPLIGDKLAGAADVIGDFRDNFIEQFRDAIEKLANPTAAFNEMGAGGAGLAAAEADPVSKILGRLLGDDGLDLLADINGDGLQNEFDIRYRSNINSISAANIEELYFDWDFDIGGTLLDAGAGIGFDIGIPGLGLETKGDINMTVAWALALGMGLNYRDGFYLDIGDDSDEDFDAATELELRVDVTVPGAGITGKLGFLQIEAEDDTTDDDGLQTHLSAVFGIDVRNRTNASDTKLGFSELGNLSIDVGIAAEAVADLGMRLALNSDLVPSAPTNFPSIVADFSLIWGVGDATPGNVQLVPLSSLGGTFLKNGLQYVGFENVGLDLGTYFSDLIGPIVSKVQEITEPIKPFLDFLTEPIPVISQLAGPTSLLDIAEMSGLVNPGIIKAIEVVDQVIDIAHSLSGISGNVILYFDGYLPDNALVIFGTKPTAGFGPQLASSTPNIDLTKAPNLNELKRFIDELPGDLGFLSDALNAVEGPLKESVQKMLPNGAASGGFSLPIIEDPSQVFGMLMGQPATLVQFEMAALEIEAEFSAFFSLLGPLGVSINAEFAAQFGPFTFGYDTLGITQFADGGFRNPLQLFNGFFVSDVNAAGVDVPELQFDAGLWAAAELNLVVARGGVGGGLFADIDFDLHDPDKDSRVRISELVTNVLNEAKYGEPALSPLAIFDITGKLTAELFAFLKLKLGFVTIFDERWHITDPITLLDFESNFVRVPTLATELGDGVLQLNMGKFASQRIEGDLTDFGETFVVYQSDHADHVKVWSPLVDFNHNGLDDNDEAQEYLATKLILAVGGEGNDTIDLSGVTSNIDFELEGNAGDDVIKAGGGTGKARILGGTGDDQLWGGGGDDTIFGETGKDTIHGGSGNDWLFGDGSVKDSIVGNVITVKMKANDGDDNIYGDDGNDLMFGAGGRDLLEGGANDDVLVGDAGVVTVDVATRQVLTVEDTDRGTKGFNDTLRGQAGKDRQYGGRGDDILEGGADADVLYGEGGADTITGGDENPLDADTANRGDLIYGGSEADTINAGAGNDTVHGEAGNDVINGGADADWLYGGTGSDIIHGNAGNDHIFGNSDPDQLYGDDGDDHLEGGHGNDTAYGGLGLDLLVAGYGSDTLNGQEGSDTYRITARGGAITELSTAYDTGSGVDDTDILVLIGTAEADTVLLRAMADFYFPTLEKLIGDKTDPDSKGLTDKIFESGEPDKLRAILQALEDSYGPHDIPNGLVQDIIDTYVNNVQSKVLAALTNAYNSSGATEPPLSELAALLNDPDDPSDPNDNVGILFTESRSKLDEMLTAIANAFGENPVPPTISDSLTNAWTDFSPNSDALKSSIEDLIEAAYQSEMDVLGSETDTGFVALINNGGANVERFNYRDLEGVVVNTLDGDDNVVLDDVIAATTVNLGLGEDRVQVGQVFRSERVRDPEGELITGITAEDVFGSTEITRGWLSNGVSRPTTINGGDDNDQFTVFRNVAVLNLNGGDGDDLFTVRAFALKGSSDNERARTDMKGDGGADTILYVVNAPVGIDGGDGFDTVRIVGTEFADDFVVTDAGIFGAGLNVSYVNIEKLVADGAEGDDRFFVQSTGLEVVTEIDGGLGSDSFFVGGNPSRAPVPVISNDFKGHSAIILHDIEAGDPEWVGVPIEGVSANVGDNEEDFVIVREEAGSSRVVESATSGGAGWQFDGYGIRLTREPGPGQKVRIAVVPAGIAPEDEAKGFKDLEFYTPTSSFGTLGTPLGFHPKTGAAIGPVLEFDSTNWDDLQYVHFSAADDAASEGRRFVFINHTLQNSTDPDYQSAQMLSVKVQMEDDDRDGVIITPSGRGNTVLENDFTDTFTVRLSQAPSDNVTVTMTTANDQVMLSPSTLTFTPLDWNIAKSVTITALSDDVVEGFHTDYIRFAVSSTDVTTTEFRTLAAIDGDFDMLGVQPAIPADKPTSYLLLPHRPDTSRPMVVKLNGKQLPDGSIPTLDPDNPLSGPARFDVRGNTLTFLSADGTPEFVTGNVEMSYSYVEPGYHGAFVKDSFVDIYDEDTPMVIIDQGDDGSVDVIEGSAATDTYQIRLSRPPAQGEVHIVVDAVDTRSTYGRTAIFKTQVNVAKSGGDSDGDATKTTLVFDGDNWNSWQAIIVSAIDDGFLDGNDTQVFAPELQTVNKIRGPLIIEGAAGAGSLSLPRPLMLPWELNILPPDGLVQSFIPGSGGGAIETMTVLLEDLNDVVERLKREDSNISEIQDLVGKTLELSQGPGTGVVLDPLRPDDRFDRFWLINEIVENGTHVILSLQNPTLVDPGQPNVIAPDATTTYAITSLSVNFFADEREQVDYLFVFDNDSVADDVGALTSSDGAVRQFTPNQMMVEPSALQAVARLVDPEHVDFGSLIGRELTITVGPGRGSKWSIESIAPSDDPETGLRRVTLTSLQIVGDAPDERSEFRIAGGDRYGRITGFGMGPNVLFAGRPQPGGITYGDIEVAQIHLGRGNDQVEVDYTTNAEDHTTKRSGDYYTLTTLDTGAGNDQVSIRLDDGDDGALSLTLGDGDDRADASGSTVPLAIFGWDGKDAITGGEADDILFGDRGRVDYVKTVELELNGATTLVDQIVTRLGHSVPQNPVNPPVTGATLMSLSDANTTFPTTYGGLVGLSVQAISPRGHVQHRTIVANDEHTIWIDQPWDAIPVFNDPLPDPVPENNYFYRFSAVPEDQTDGVFRGPRVVWSIDDEIGDDDTVNAGGGRDIVIGGAGNDFADSGDDADWVAGDDARFDFVPLDGLDGPTWLKTITDPGTDGDDTLLGGDDPDILIGGLGNDIIDGQGNNDLLIGDNATLEFVLDGDRNGDGIVDEKDAYLVRIETTNRDQGGTDTIDGGADDDIVIGGANDDALDGGTEDDLIFGDNVTLDLHEGSGDAITPRFRAMGGSTIYDMNGDALYGNRVAPPAIHGMPAWTDWTITLDPSLAPQQFGNDVIAGGAHRDTIFGQRGDDVIQGDGSRSTGAAASRDANGLLQVTASWELATDGDDYIEGNAGRDVIFGNLGQDDLIGGSSSLFSLNPRELRDDEGDLIFGGAGSDIARDQVGDGDNGRDADVIVGDNANIYRLVANGAYAGFNYDNNYAVQIVPRAVELIDYTPGGADFVPASIDIGGEDELHGESGDDAIYGMAGNDVLFGEGHDDDLIGGWGHDWISGGTGQDGVIGDDGRIMTSRNTYKSSSGDTGLAEPLYGIAKINAVGTSGVDSQTITTPGNIQTAVINVEGQLTKSVNLTPFNLQPMTATNSIQNPLFRPQSADDIIFGGRGDDFLHGSAGDDAMSGAEARPSGMYSYATPGNPGNVLEYGLVRAGEFGAYDEYNPMTRIADFLLDFEANDGDPVAGSSTIRTDGNDAVFGDLGNDWLVGGTGRDNLYGGFGDDLLNVDDDLSTAGGLNTSPDTHATYEDRAFGGAGRDVLIANTGGDRLIDWAGEFNSYVVPFAPFGNATVSRTLQPQLAEFLYALSASDGADPTRAADTGKDAARNGEPEGELGLVRQQDAAWQDQTGAPADPQPGNVPGGPRDVLRSASFNDGNMQGLAADSGTWQVSSGSLQVAANSTIADAVAVYHVGDPLPSYFEVQATIQVVKPTSGWKANSYIIFDYQSATDFKFAGLNVSTNKLEIGRRTSNGWQVLSQSPVPGGLKDNTWYNLLLSVNGLTATLIVNNKSTFSQTFSPTVVDGWSYGLNWGLVGFGSDRSRGMMDDIAVNVVPPSTTVTHSNDFTGGAGMMVTGVPNSSTGSWVAQIGRLIGTPAAGSDAAIQLLNLSGVTQVDGNSLLQLSATLQTAGRSGIVFDYYSDTDFKFAAIDVGTKQLIIGHRTRSGWKVDAAVSHNQLNATTDYTLGVVLKGSTVSITLNGQAALGFSFNALTTDGRFGLLAVNTTASFDSVTVKTNDPSVPAP